MTDIDVSGCCLYKNGICLTDKGKCTSMCDYGAYAREEELKRIETENKKLKEKLKKIKKGLRTCSIGCKKCSIQNFCQTYKIRQIIEGAENE